MMTFSARLYRFLYFWLVTGVRNGQYKIMIGIIFKIIAALFGLLALYVMWLDITATNSPSIAMGQFWFEHHSASLQVGESIISRYVDPCGLIVAFNCEPFLWHPLIASLLGWPAALVLIILTLVFGGLGRLSRKGSSRRTSKRALHRNGAA
jgi:hypothetical protein